MAMSLIDKPLTTIPKSKTNKMNQSIKACMHVDFYFMLRKEEHGRMDISITYSCEALESITWKYVLLDPRRMVPPI